jgi:hypothetical protein
MVRSLLIPAILGGFLIVSLCLAEGLYLKDRWGTPGVEAEIMGERFKQVPKEIGDWKGEDLPVDEQVKKTAGAVKYVSRSYKNSETGAQVVLWLIVGHSRDICRHTPNICYPSAGFRQEGSQLRHHMDLESGKPAEFYTGKFIKDDVHGRRAERVFWAWNHPDHNKWEAPGNQRQHYGLSRALYKLYFTSNVLASESKAEDNIAAEFAELMLPEVDKALFPESNPALSVDPSKTSDETVEDTKATDTKATDTEATDTEATDTEVAETEIADGEVTDAPAE